MANPQNRNEIEIELKRIFGENNVVKEWNVAENSMDQFTRKLYCPRVDFAVKPFNTDLNFEYNNGLINSAYERFEGLLLRLKLASDAIMEDFDPNQNPRCFLAIELENKTSRKHRLGSLYNASVIGKIGIVVAKNTQVYNSLVKIRKYFEFLKNAWKSPYTPKNIMIVTESDFLRVLEEYPAYSQGTRTELKGRLRN
jgi:hypothetical protein